MCRKWKITFHTNATILGLEMPVMALIYIHTSFTSKYSVNIEVLISP